MMPEKHKQRFRLSQFLAWPTNGWLARPVVIWPATRSDRISLLRVLQLAIEERRPLVPMIEALAQDEKSSQRWRLGRLLAQLREGRTLPDALEATAGILPRRDVARIRANHQLGLASSNVFLADASMGSECRTAVDPHAMIWRTVWYLVMTLGTAIMVSIYLYSTLATAETILRDMEATVPRAMRTFRWLGEQMEAWVWILAFVVLLAVLLGWSRRARRALTRMPWVSRLLFTRDWHAAELLSTIASSAEAGRPLVSTVSTLARTYHDPKTRHQLLVVRNELDHGTDAWETFQHAQILDATDVRVIRLEEASDDFPGTLRKLAATKRSKAVTRMNVLLQVGQWILIFVLGLGVLGLGIVLFEFVSSALVTLVEKP